MKHENDCFAHILPYIMENLRLRYGQPMEGRQRANWFSGARNSAFTHLPNSKRSLVIEMTDNLCWDTSWTCNCSILHNLTLYPCPVPPSNLIKTSSLTTKSRSLTKLLLRHWWIFNKVTKILPDFDFEND
jgi:hypothetical protein